MVPVSVRADSERGALGNRVSTMYAPLPIGVEDPLARFRAVHEAMRGLKESGQAVGAEVLTSLADFAPPTILAQAARLQSRQRFFNLTVTNVPGPQFPLYLLGRPLARIYPLVPLAETTALGIAIMSYDGHIDFGLLGRLRRAARPRRRRRRASRRRSPSWPRSRASRAGRAQRPRAARPAPARARSAVAGPLAPLTLALAQVDPRVGDLEGNARLVREHIARARDARRRAGAVPRARR